ncbi:MAG: hypothetical protein GY750_00880 [Lentisphaerae bacterium]|nr:hypothetical protein [Lentisphaerota bacterium]MCP4099972.1 hypothetical protein [Lentisphaerota bacterium]
MKKALVVAFCGVDASGKTSNLEGIFKRYKAGSFKVKKLRAVNSSSKYATESLKNFKF